MADILRLENANEKAEPLIISSSVFEQPVRIVGNYSVVLISGVCFNKGLQIIPLVRIGKPVLTPKVVRLFRVDATAENGVYPIKISAAMSLANPFDRVVLCECEVFGNGKPYKKDALGWGTPDNVSIQGVRSLELENCRSRDGGENGFSLNACERISGRNIIAHGCDGQGLHVGRHVNGFGVEELNIDGFISFGNWKNQLNVGGSGCGALLQGVKQATLREFASFDNEHAVSNIYRGESAQMTISGSAYGCGSRPILATSNVTFNAALSVGDQIAEVSRVVEW